MGTRNKRRQRKKQEDKKKMRRTKQKSGKEREIGRPGRKRGCWAERRPTEESCLCGCRQAAMP